MTIKLPDMPTPRGFDNQQQYGLALDKWLQCCTAVAAEKIVLDLDKLGTFRDGWIKQAAERIHDQYPETSMPLLYTVIRDAVNGAS